MDLFSNYRYNPFTETFTPNPIGYSGNPPEVKTIPSSAPFWVYLDELPREDSPISSLLVEEQGGPSFVEVSKTTPPAAGQFRAIYGGDGVSTAAAVGQSILEFNSADAGKIIEASYYGLGTVLQKQFIDFIINITHPIGSLLALHPKTIWTPNSNYWAFCDGTTELPSTNFSIQSETEPSTSVDTGVDYISSTGHQLYTADKVHYTTTDTAIGGLSPDTDYYIIRNSDNNFRLANSLTNALDGIYIDLTSVGAGFHTFRRKYVPNLRYDVFLQGSSPYERGGNTKKEIIHNHQWAATPGGNQIKSWLSNGINATGNIGGWATLTGAPPPAAVNAIDFYQNYIDMFTKNNDAVNEDIRPYYFAVDYYLRIN